jgi:protein-S-isoprenylcysteine O-methyltransferase Ste14
VGIVIRKSPVEKNAWGSTRGLSQESVTPDCDKKPEAPMSRYSRWAQIEEPEGKRIAATLLAGVIFVILLPFTVVVVGQSLDRLLGLQCPQIGAVNLILGGMLVIAGLFFALWSIIVQLTRGRGTPLPMMPTQELLTEGPFRYCRNPMTFGTILAYFGIAVIAATIAGVGLVLCFATFLVFYLKRIEERELAERFGQAYVVYKREVPFIVPRMPRQQ